MSWTDERIERLKGLWMQGMTASQIAEELGAVSRNAVIGKAHRLGLQSRPSPVKPNEDGSAPAAAPAASETEGAPWEEPAAPARPAPPAPAAAAPQPAPAGDGASTPPAAPAPAAAPRAVWKIGR